VSPRWEPGSRLPLRWGTYHGRYLAGLLLIVAGLVLLTGTNTYTVIFLLFGTVAHATGWLILPAPGSRRLTAVGPSLVAAWLMLIGPQILTVLVLPYLGWLFVRERPARSYPTAILVLAAGLVLAACFHTSHDEPVAFAIASAVVVGSAWLARYLATTKR
jgi:drug/metabolite transporter (DMT)-like permease